MKRQVSVLGRTCVSWPSAIWSLRKVDMLELSSPSGRMRAFTGAGDVPGQCSGNCGPLFTAHLLARFVALPNRHLGAALSVRAGQLISITWKASAGLPSGSPPISADQLSQPRAACQQGCPHGPSGSCARSGNLQSKVSVMSTKRSARAT
jgi:hypothetical protein